MVCINFKYCVLFGVYLSSFIKIDEGTWKGTTIDQIKLIERQINIIHQDLISKYDIRFRANKNVIRKCQFQVMWTHSFRRRDRSVYV